MNNDCLVSICIPTFNGEKYLRDAIKSALNQTYRNIEIIISDDNSKDLTLQIIDEFSRSSDIPIFVFANIPNGIGANWNNCVKHAKGKYIKFLFQDDILDANCIEELIKPFIKDEKVGLSFCKRNFLLESENNSFTHWINRYSSLHDGWTSLQYIQKGKRLLGDKNLLLHPKNKIGEPTAVLLKKEVFQKVGYFRTDIKQSLDYEFWYRVLSKYHVGFVDKILISFRLHESQATFKNNESEIIDYQTYPKLIYKNLFWCLHPSLKKELFYKYNRFGRVISKVIQKCRQYMP